VKRAFDRIKGSISMTIGSRLATTILTELHGEFVVHFSAIFITEIDGFYRDILGKSGAPPQPVAVKASCWGLVTKLLRVLFKEIHKVRVEAAGLENIRDDPARVNGSYLYAALEELCVLREFKEHEYRQHPKFHHFVVMHLFDTALPRAVFEARTDGAGRDVLWLTSLENGLADQGTSINWLEMALGTVRQSLGIPAPATRNRGKRGGGGSKTVTIDGVAQLE
jgi:hypothetical protein